MNKKNIITLGLLIVVAFVFVGFAGKITEKRAEAAMISQYVSGFEAFDKLTVNQVAARLHGITGRSTMTQVATALGFQLVDNRLTAAGTVAALIAVSTNFGVAQGNAGTGGLPTEMITCESGGVSQGTEWSCDREMDVTGCDENGPTGAGVCFPL